MKKNYKKLNITVKDNKIDSDICNNFIKKCNFSNYKNEESSRVNELNIWLTPLKIIDYLNQINQFYNIEESSKVFLHQSIILNKYLN